MPYGQHHPTPAQIISWLPKDATPEQKDSAIQRHIKPSEIHWSERPDTLHLPGHTAGKSVLDVSRERYVLRKTSKISLDCGLARTLAHHHLPLTPLGTRSLNEV